MFIYYNYWFFSPHSQKCGLFVFWGGGNRTEKCRKTVKDQKASENYFHYFMNKLWINENGFQNGFCFRFLKKWKKFSKLSSRNFRKKGSEKAVFMVFWKYFSKNYWKLLTKQYLYAKIGIVKVIFIIFENSFYKNRERGENCLE